MQYFCHEPTLNRAPKIKWKDEVKIIMRENLNPDPIRPEIDWDQYNGVNKKIIQFFAQNSFFQYFHSIHKLKASGSIG